MASEMRKGNLFNKRCWISWNLCEKNRVFTPTTHKHQFHIDYRHKLESENIKLLEANIGKYLQDPSIGKKPLNKYISCKVLKER